MKTSRNLVILLLLLTYTAVGQIHLTPFVGINSTRLTTGYFGYENGGNFPLAGVELEGRLKPRKISPLHVSFVTGATYLANGYFENRLFSFLSYYGATTTDLSTRYVQIPFMIKLNWQPFPLVEDFQLFVAGGVSNNILLSANLTEKITKVFQATDIYAPPQTTYYYDSQDITDLGVKNSLFTRFDLGIRYKRMQIAFRISISQSDMYYRGLEKVWTIPPAESGYISGHTNAGSTKEKYSELVVGYRVF